MSIMKEYSINLELRLTYSNVKHTVQSSIL